MNSSLFLWYLWDLWHLKSWSWHLKKIKNFKCHEHLILFFDISNLCSHSKCHFWHISFWIGLLNDRKYFPYLWENRVSLCFFNNLINASDRKTVQDQQNHIYSFSQLCVHNLKTNHDLHQIRKATFPQKMFLDLQFLHISDELLKLISFLWPKCEIEQILRYRDRCHNSRFHFFKLFEMS